MKKSRAKNGNNIFSSIEYFHANQKLTDAILARLLAEVLNWLLFRPFRDLIITTNPHDVFISFCTLLIFCHNCARMSFFTFVF